MYEVVPLSIIAWLTKSVPARSYTCWAVGDDADEYAATNTRGSGSESSVAASQVSCTVVSVRVPACRFPNVGAVTSAITNDCPLFIVGFPFSSTTRSRGKTVSPGDTVVSSVNLSEDISGIEYNGIYTLIE